MRKARLCACEVEKATIDRMSDRVFDGDDPDRSGFESSDAFLGGLFGGDEGVGVGVDGGREIDGAGLFAGKGGGTTDDASRAEPTVDRQGRIVREAAVTADRNILLTMGK